MCFGAGKLSTMAQRVKECRACGQGFDEANRPVGVPVPTARCPGGIHEGPVERIATGLFNAGVPLCFELPVADIPETLIEQAQAHKNGSVHASSMFNGDEDDSVKNWFNLSLVHPIPWECPHPNELPLLNDSRLFVDYFDQIQAHGLRIWDIQRQQNSTGYLTVRAGDKKIHLSGRADLSSLTST